MPILILVFLLLLSVPLTEKLHVGCVGIFVYTLIFSGMILQQLMELKKDINTFACPFCQPNSLCERFCKSVKLYAIFAFFFAVTISLSLITFLFLVTPFFYYIMFMDIFVAYYIFKSLAKSKTKQLVQHASKIYFEIIGNVLNISLLMVMLVTLEFQMSHNLHMSPEIFGYIVKNVNHSCTLFQHLLRTKELLDISIYGLRDIKGIGNWLFGFFYISTLSLFPLLGITLLYKFAVKFYYSRKIR